jgi:uncharacterized repeat protein (TIGR01451 family)
MAAETSMSATARPSSPRCRDSATSTDAPQFVNAADDTYRLEPGSPAVKSDQTSRGWLRRRTWTAPARILDAVVDIGAYETPTDMDLAVMLSVDNASPHIGDPVTWTVTVTNCGAITLTGIVVNYPLPTGVTETGLSVSQGAYAAGTWDVGTLAPGAAATLHFTGEVDKSGTRGRRSTAPPPCRPLTWSSSDTGNDAATVTVRVPLVDLAVGQDRGQPDAERGRGGGVHHSVSNGRSGCGDGREGHRP